MAFLNTESSVDSPAPQGGGYLADIYLLLLRLVMTAPLFYYQIRQQSVVAWQSLWEKKDWPLLNAVTEMGLPQPQVTTVALVFVLVACPLGIVLGFLTRINAALTLLAILFFFLSGLPFSEWMTGQTYVLFLGIAAVLTLSGPGRLSFDGLYAAVRQHKKRLRDQAAL